MEAPKAATARLVAELLTRYPDAEVLGHGDVPKVSRAYLSFDGRSWWASVQPEVL